MFNFKALALTALAATTLTVAAPQAQANPGILENQPVYQELLDQFPGYMAALGPADQKGVNDVDGLCYYAARIVGAVNYLENDGFRRTAIMNGLEDAERNLRICQKRGYEGPVAPRNAAPATTGGNDYAGALETIMGGLNDITTEQTGADLHTVSTYTCEIKEPVAGGTNCFRDGKWTFIRNYN